MTKTRVLTALAMALVGLPAILAGGIFYFLLMGTFVVGATWEYVRLFRATKMEPNEPVAIGGVFLIILTRLYFSDWATTVFTGLILLALSVHLIAYERGRDQAALDFGATLGALAYLGWVGAYLVNLRSLPNGAWWVLLILPCVFATDTGAYVIGAAYGKHKMSPRLSPKKSWEGYAAGIVTAVYVGALFTYAFNRWGSWGGWTADIAIWQGAALGALIGALAPLGDFGESLFKRQSGMKDSSAVFPGHGGFFDRIDSWLWGAVIGYYFIQWFIL